MHLVYIMRMREALSLLFLHLPASLSFSVVGLLSQCRAALTFFVPRGQCQTSLAELEHHNRYAVGLMQMSEAQVLRLKSLRNTDLQLMVDGW